LTVLFGHSSTRKQSILEGDMSFESPKCPLKSGLTNCSLNIKTICEISGFSSLNQKIVIYNIQRCNFLVSLDFIKFKLGHLFEATLGFPMVYRHPKLATA
jgi:hypothetical protein